MLLYHDLGEEERKIVDALVEAGWSRDDALDELERQLLGDERELH